MIWLQSHCVTTKCPIYSVYNLEEDTLTSGYLHSKAFLDLNLSMKS